MAGRFLFILRRPPVPSLPARETLDQLMTAAAFEQPVTVLVLDAAVDQLRRPAPGVDFGAEPVAPLFEALPLYDVDTVLVERESLAGRGLTERDLIVPVRLLGRSEVAAVVSAHDIVVNG